MKLIIRGALLLLMMTASHMTFAESQTETQQSGDFNWAPFHRVGDSFPDATLLDQDGQPVVISESSGNKGYLVLFNRSVVW